MMPPYSPYVASQTPWQPEQYNATYTIKLMGGLPRYGYSKDINSVLSHGVGKNNYLMGIVLSSCCLLIVLLIWCLALVVLRFYSNSWASGCMERPLVPPPQHVSRFSSEPGDDDTSSTSASSISHSSDCTALSIDSSIFWTDNIGREELTMAVIAQEQKLDELLLRARKKRPQNFSTTTNGQLTLITTLDSHTEENRRGCSPQFRVYVPPSLRLPLLRTYHDCLIHPDDVSNAQTMIYEFFTWKDIRQDVSKYVRRYRQCMERGGNAMIVRYQYDDGIDFLDENTPITLDVIAQEQRDDIELAHMMVKAPSVFSTATNGSIQLVTARGRDKKYRIVIPTSLQAKVLKTYHDCLVNPTQENNFKMVLYVHFTWNGIHKDVESYVRNEGLTEEMMGRSVQRKQDDEHEMSLSDNLADYHLNATDCSTTSVGDFTPHNVKDNELDACIRPIGLDEIAKEQKKDKELRQLKKEEPFVFSTVRYGNTLLTTAQNFRDNKYRIVIPRRLQGRMLRTYRECLLNPTPDRNFDTLLYNHFTWNGIHDDVDYFVKNHGNVPIKEAVYQDNEESGLFPLVRKLRGKKYENQSGRHDTEYLEWCRKSQKFEQKIRLIRSIFLLCGLLTIISSIMFFECGVNRIFKSLNEARLGLQHIEAVAGSLLSLTGYYIELQSDIHSTAQRIGTYNSSLWCTPMQSHVTSKFAMDMRNSTYAVGVQLRDTAVRVELELNRIEKDLEKLVGTAQNVHATFEDLATYVDVAKVLVISIDIIVISLMSVCTLAWTGYHHFIPKCMKKSLIIPLLVFLLILCWIFSATVLLGALAGADFCSSPDESATSLVVGYEGQMSSLVFMSMIYYITSCVPERQPLKLVHLSSAVSTVGKSLHSQLSAIAEAMQQPGLADLCGGEAGFSKLAALLELTDTSVHAIYDNILGVREILECNNINPVYTTLVYDVFCNSAVSGLSWVFFTSLSVAVFTMTMVTLRVAVHQY